MIFDTNATVCVEISMVLGEFLDEATVYCMNEYERGITPIQLSAGCFDALQSYVEHVVSDLMDQEPSWYGNGIVYGIAD